MTKKIKLKECLDLIIDHRGKTPKKLGGDWAINGKYRALSAKNVKNMELVNEDTIRSIDNNIYEKWMTQEIQKEDILLTSEAPLGELLFWDSDEKIVLSQRLFALRVNKKIIYPKYLFAFMNSSFYQKELQKKASGSTVFGIRQELLWDTIVIAPDMETQKKIGDDIYKVLKLIEFNNQLLKDFGEYIDLLFNKHFLSSEGLVDDVALKKIPLAKLARNKKNIFDPTKEKSMRSYIGLEHMNKGQLMLSEWGSSEELESNKYQFVEGDILFGKLRPYFKKVTVAPFDGISSTDILVVEPKEPKYHSYLLAVLRRDIFIDFCIATATGTRMPRATWASMEKFEVPMPDDVKLKKFNEIVDPIVELVKIISKENKQLKEVRDLMIKKYVG